MKNYDSEIVAETAKEAASSHWLISIALTTPLYFTGCDIPIPYGGHLYLSRGLKVTEIPQTSGFSTDAARVELDDTDRAVIAALESEDAANKEVILYFTVLNAANRAIATAEVARGAMFDWDATNQSVVFTLGSEFRFWRKKSLRLPTPNCPWVFAESTECGYAGAETWCDQSPERCAVLGNYLNFGGRKFIAAVEDQKVYWGPAGY